MQKHRTEIRNRRTEMWPHRTEIRRGLHDRPVVYMMGCRHAAHGGWIRPRLGDANGHCHNAMGGEEGRPGCHNFFAASLPPDKDNRRQSCAGLGEVDGGGGEGFISIGSAQVPSIQRADGVRAQGAGGGTGFHRYEFSCLGYYDVGQLSLVLLQMDLRP